MTPILHFGNPAMPMKMPMGPKWFRRISWNIPNIIQANIPGYESAATALMKKTITLWAYYSEKSKDNNSEISILNFFAVIKCMPCMPRLPAAWIYSSMSSV